MSPPRPHSEETGKAIDAEVREIIDLGYQQAIAILQANRDLLETITKQLIRVEVVEGEELTALLNQVRPLDFPELPVDPVTIEFEEFPTP